MSTDTRKRETLADWLARGNAPTVCPPAGTPGLADPKLREIGVLPDPQVNRTSGWRWRKLNGEGGFRSKAEEEGAG